MDNDFDRAKRAISEFGNHVRLGIALQNGKRIVRVNIDRNESAELVARVHQRLRDIPHEVRRVTVATMEARSLP